MRVIQGSMVVAVALAMGVSAASTDLPNLSTAQNPTGTGSAASTATSTTGSGTTSAATTGSSSASKVSITGSGSAASSGSVPTITGTSATTDAALTGLPTLTGAVVAFTVTVPNLSSAPFMQTSNLPDGTVFIVVGAILGFLALCVLLWRGLVNWTLRRSVKNAARLQNLDDKKELFRTPAPPAAFYTYSDRESTASLGQIVNKNRKSHRPGTSGAGASTSNLFFSPSAGPAGANLPGNRGSSYLPSGYYAAGASTVNNGQRDVHLGGTHAHGISMSSLRPESQGYGRARGLDHSPPDSPGFSAQSRHMASSSTLNLNEAYAPGVRAPSAYLEDLIDGDNTTPPPPPHSRR